MNFDTMKHGNPGGGADVEDGDDARGGGGRRRSAGLGRGRRRRRGVATRWGCGNLDGDERARKLLVTGQVDAAEATLAQELLDAVAADVRRAVVE